MEFVLCFIFFILGIIAGIVIPVGRYANVVDCWIDDIIFDISEYGAGFRHGRIYLGVTDNIVSFIDKKRIRNISMINVHIHSKNVKIIKKK